MLNTDYELLENLFDEGQLGYDIAYPEYYSIFLRKISSGSNNPYHEDNIIGATNLVDMKINDIIINPYRPKSFLKVIDIDEGKQRILLDLIT